MGRVILLVIAVLTCWPIIAGAADLTGRASVIDGDAIEIHGQRIRLHGIDAPESAQTCEAGGQTYRCGQQAALALADQIGRRTVACEQRDVDRYARIVAVCRAGGEDLNGWFVSQGLALAYRQYATDYVDEEAAARASRLGIWRGTFVPPSDWRRGVRTPSAGVDEPHSAAKCCRVCSTGKACGNTCISKSKTCRKAPGCACDAQ